MSKDLLRGHNRFRTTHVGGHGEFLRRLADTQQSPDAVYIGCCDSRIIPELLTSSSPGELFVVRNIANLVPPLRHAYVSVGAALEYGVSQLNVAHVIVCGHYGCGGVRAALDGFEQPGTSPSLTEWLRLLADPVARARTAGGDDDTIWRRAVEENVIDQLDHLITFPCVDQALERGVLQLHGWVYDPKTLALRVYDVDSDRFLPSSSLLRK